MRLFLQDSGPSNADLKVNLIYEGVDGSVQNVTIAKLQGSTAWQPSIAIPLAISVLASSFPGGLMPVAFQFQPEGLGNGQTWSIDGLSFAQPVPGRYRPTPATASFTTSTRPNSQTPDSCNTRGHSRARSRDQTRLYITAGIADATQSSRRYLRITPWDRRESADPFSESGGPSAGSRRWMIR